VLTDKDSCGCCRSLSAAVRCCVDLQKKLLQVDWPSEVLTWGNCMEQRDSQGRIIWRGLRVRMGMAYGRPQVRLPLNTGLTFYQPHLLLSCTTRRQINPIARSRNSLYLFLSEFCCMASQIGSPSWICQRPYFLVPFSSALMFLHLFGQRKALFGMTGLAKTKCIRVKTELCHHCSAGAIYLRG
jgi:hypothetical protein